MMLVMMLMLMTMVITIIRILKFPILCIFTDCPNPCNITF